MFMKSFISSANSSTWLACTPDEILFVYIKIIRDPGYFLAEFQI